MELMMFVVALIVLAIYFFPSIIAFVKGKKDKIAIGALNLLAGWTFIGWVVSFVWSLKND